jgi:hypothetical protein
MKIKGMKDNFIDPVDATNFIERVCIGGFTKSDLDDARMLELNQMDMMYDCQINDHPESINEFQLAGLIVFYITSLHRKHNEEYEY